MYLRCAIHREGFGRALAIILLQRIFGAARRADQLDSRVFDTFKYTKMFWIIDLYTLSCAQDKRFFFQLMTFFFSYQH